MRAYLIDPEAQTVTEVAYSGNYRDIYSLIDCECFTTADLDQSETPDTIYLDDEGLMKGPTCFFWPEGYCQPLAGKGLVLGTDEEGTSISPRRSLDDVRAAIEFGSVVSIAGTAAWLPASGRLRRID